MKPANLTSALLTRKGQAQPTLISPPRSAAPITPVSPSALPPLLRPKELPAAPATEVWPGYNEAYRFAAVPRAAFDRRVHMSLRLDPGRHLRLRLEASRTGRSMQSLLLQALDEFLACDGPGTRGGHSSHNGTFGNHEIGNRREPEQPIGAETDGGPTRSR